MKANLLGLFLVWWPLPLSCGLSHRFFGGRTNPSAQTLIATQRTATPSTIHENLDSVGASTCTATQHRARRWTSASRQRQQQQSGRKEGNQMEVYHAHRSKECIWHLRRVPSQVDDLNFLRDRLDTLFRQVFETLHQTRALFQICFQRTFILTDFGHHSWRIFPSQSQQLSDARFYLGQLSASLRPTITTREQTI